MTHFRSAHFPALAAILFGCGSSGSDVPNTAANGGASSRPSDSLQPGGTGNADASSVAEECEPTTNHDQPADPRFIQELSATVVDETGSQLSELLAQVCGLDVCVNARTDSSGMVNIMPEQRIEKPAFKYALGISYAKFAYSLPPGDAHALGEVPTVALPDTEEGQPLTPGETLSSGKIELTLEPNTEVKIDRLTYTTPEMQRFRAVEVPLDRASPAIDPTLELVYATTPVDTELCPPAQLKLPNLRGWPAGTAVEFLVHGVSIEQSWAPYGGWAKVSHGSVSADETSITTDPEAGIPVLSAIGVRRR